MKVVIISRSTLFSSPGGDTTQIKETAKALRNFGVVVDIRLADETIDYEAYDLIHFFNIIRPNDIIRHTKQANLPFVVSTIFVDYQEFEKISRKGLAGLLNKILSANQIESIKAIARGIKKQEKFPMFRYLVQGHKRSVQEIIRRASVLLPNSNSEYQRLQRAYGIDKRFVVVPNGIDTTKFFFKENIHRDIVLCVARFEPLKNQLNLIRALKGTSYQLYLIGSASKNHSEYLQACKQEANENVHFVEHIKQEELVQYYQRAKVHVLASWFETTGLSSLEAAAIGCNLVITSKGDTTDYFKNNAFYCEPDDPVSIGAAINEAFNSPINPDFSKYIADNFNWKTAAEKTLEGYNMCNL